MPRPPRRGGSPRDNPSRFDDYLRYISMALFGVGMIAVLLVANSDLFRPHAVDRVALNVIVAAAGLSVAGILLFPWRRYHRNLFLVVVLNGLFLIALAVYFSGGWKSPFFPFYFFVVVFCVIYFSLPQTRFCLWVPNASPKGSSIHSNLRQIGLDKGWELRP